jgi:FKBP-type peptidyl-prolyl cis-trans isomerase SlpA
MSGRAEVNMSEHRIADNMEVSLHFRLRIEDGTEVDSTFDKAPATLEIGDGNLPPGF